MPAGGMLGDLAAITFGKLMRHPLAVVAVVAVVALLQPEDAERRRPA